MRRYKQSGDCNNVSGETFVSRNELKKSKHRNMEANKFYNHVSSWIKSYRNAEALQRLRAFINSSTQPVDIKEKLNGEIDRKIAGLKQRPMFAMNNGICYLADSEGHPQVFTTRFSAVCKLAELKMNGYDAELKPGSVFYRIQINEPAPMEEMAA